MIKTVLFDLDGTLLPMDNEEFTKYYFGLLCKKLAPLGYKSDELIAAVWAGTKAMVLNDGSITNEEAFWIKFKSIYGEESMKDLPIFEDFYKNEFDGAKAVCGFNQGLVDFVHYLKDKGVKVGLATNPIFPYIATEKRIGWAGLKPEDFEVVTTYENIGFCKPNLEYYKEVLARMGAKAEETLMVGNDVDEDMVAAKLGMKVFLLDANVLNKSGKDISDLPKGDCVKLKEYFETLI